ncbi:SDR family oxidoreductase [Wenzhouxiangella sp. XN24]|uniref:SDR family oxidoreductase n=1 Tax=Wenzhouxiangella sp. XN24 TaxID=2713569 RepID=UPI0013E9ADE1|nr:SDR family oxidoreductase [Wenzhouxiangella sp. XN24]NGX15085.1 SDR family oxidoreductase [Wenzhouxiangella sp. XN24]
MGEFSGNVIVVTGASEGIGRALCEALAPQGPRLVLAARNAERLESLASACRAAGAETLVVPCDLEKETECRELIDRTVEHFGRLDTLVANAGRTMWARADEIRDSAVFRSVMELNYFSVVWLTLAALPHLKTTRGRLVPVASVAGLTGVPERSAYCASKHAVIGFFDSLRIELADSGVTVTTVCPDFVVTEIHRRALDAQGHPLGTSPMQEARIMTAEECAALMVPAMAARRRMLITSTRGKLGRVLKLIAPGLIDRIAARAIAERK